jgi:hypothetical protein
MSSTEVLTSTESTQFDMRVPDVKEEFRKFGHASLISASPAFTGATLLQV